MFQSPQALPKYGQLKKMLENAIAAGEYPPHSALPTQQALMERYRVSFSTVRHALVELQREKVVYSRPGKGIFVAEPTVRESARRRVFSLVGIHPDWFLQHPTGGWIAGLLQAQHELEFLMHPVVDAGRGGMAQRLRDGTETTDGALVMHLPGVELLVRLMQEADFPYVVLNVPLRREDINAMVIDHEDGACEATTHLLRRGHRRIGYVGLDASHGEADAWSRAKWDGYVRAIKSAGLTVRSEDVVMARDVAEAHGKTFAARVLEDTILPRRGEMTGLFVSIESVAYRVLQELEDAGVRVPDELAVVGFNDREPVLRRQHSLTTVRLPMEEAASEAVRLLCRQIGGRERYPRQEIFRGQLVIRGSSGG
jgi:DNA-binding transcriptional regulator YhcF (GntR family)